MVKDSGVGRWYGVRYRDRQEMMTMNNYTLKTMAYYRALCQRDSLRLFKACWRQYVGYLRSSIDDPTCDDDVLSWLDSIAAEKVNNSRSTFYLRG